MQVLVDTSVWLRALAGKQPYASHLDALLRWRHVLGHPFVYGELLMGDNGGRAELLERYELLRTAVVMPHREVVAFVRSQSLQARKLGWVDVHLIASAINAEALLWSADGSISLAAQDLGIEHR
jgi:predicted nucleic acid-binding protein